MLRGLVLVGLVAAILAPAGAPSSLSAPCTGPDLNGTFSVQKGSAGAGNIVYTLNLANSSTHTCFVTGIPQLKLLDVNHRALPTNAKPAFPGALTAVLVTLAPGQHTNLTARFSPDVPGPGEGHPGPCEKTGHWLRVSPSGGGSVTVPVKPPTPVCEHGGMTISVFTAAH
jgi:hypothetical protein